MNQTITRSANSICTTPFTHIVTMPDAENRDSLLKRTISNITKIAKDFCMTYKSIPQHKSFMDENLLDPVVGPEIIRSLRR